MDYTSVFLRTFRSRMICYFHEKQRKSWSKWTVCVAFERLMHARRPHYIKKEWLSIFNRPQLRVQVSSVPQNAMIVLLKTLITRSQWLILLLWLNLYKLNNIIYGMSSHFFQFHFFFISYDFLNILKRSKQWKKNSKKKSLGHFQ